MEKEINKLWHSMVIRRWLFFFTRNNPIHTNRYYYWLIEIAGSERYFGSPIVRNEWDGSRYDFDKMYGLVVRWRRNFDIIKGEESQYTEFGDCLDRLISKRISDLQSDMEKISVGIIPLAAASEENGKKLLENYISIKNKILDIERTVKTQKADKPQTVKLSQKINLIEELDKLYNDLVEFYVFVKNSEKDTREKAEVKEKTDADNGSEDETQGETLMINIKRRK